MTQNSLNQRPKIALFEPDIPQNTANNENMCLSWCKIRDYRAMWLLIDDKRFGELCWIIWMKKKSNFTKVLIIFWI